MKLNMAAKQKESRKHAEILATTKQKAGQLGYLLKIQPKQTKLNITVSVEQDHFFNMWY